MKIKIPFTKNVLSITPEQNKFIEQKDVKKAPQAITYSAPTRTPYSDTFGKHIDVRIFYWLYRQQSDLAACVNFIQKNVGLEGYEFYSTDDKDIDYDMAESLTSLLEYNSSFDNIKKVIVRDYLLAGNAYATFIENLDNSNALGMQTIDPRTMGIVVNQYGDIKKYVQRVQGKQAVLFEPEEVMHFTIEKDPDNEVFGYPKLTPTVLEAITDVEARNLNIAFFKNDARPSTIYVLEEGLSEEEQDSAMENIRNVFGGGGANKKKSAAIAGVKEIKTIGATQTEMEFLDQRKFSIDKICATFGIPKFMFGYTESVNNNNGVELTKNTIKREIIPIEQALSSAINRWFSQSIDGYGESNTRFRFKKQILESPSEIEDRAIKMKDAGVITTREAKEFIGHTITAEMEQQENFDSFIIKGGSSSVLLEEVGVDPVVDATSDIEAQNFVRAIETLSNDNEK